jgi:hypothetical protein
MSGFSTGNDDLADADLPSTSSYPSPRVSSRRGGRTGGVRDRFHLAVASRRLLDADTIRQIGAVVQRTPYDIRTRIRGDLPKPIVHFDTLEKAEAAAADVRALGLVTVVFRELSLPPIKPFEVRALEVAGDGFDVKDRQGSRRSVRTDELLLLLCGRRTTRSVETNFHLVIRDSSDHSSVSLERAAERHSDTNGFVMWFLRNATQAPLEFRADRFDYSCLRGRVGLSDDVNFPRLIETMQAWLSEVALDRRMLDRGVEDLVGSYYNRRLGVDEAIASATLVFWQFLAEHSGQNHFTFREAT